MNSHLRAIERLEINFLTISKTYKYNVFIKNNLYIYNMQ